MGFVTLRIGRVRNRMRGQMREGCIVQAEDRADQTEERAVDGAKGTASLRDWRALEFGTPLDYTTPVILKSGKNLPFPLVRQ